MGTLTAEPGIQLLSLALSLPQSVVLSRNHLRQRVYVYVCTRTRGRGSYTYGTNTTFNHASVVVLSHNVLLVPYVVRTRVNVLVQVCLRVYYS